MEPTIVNELNDTGSNVKRLCDLEALLRKQDTLIANRTFLETLPDRGAKLVAFREKLITQIRLQQEMEKAKSRLSTKMDVERMHSQNPTLEHLSHHQSDVLPSDLHSLLIKRMFDDELTVKNGERFQPSKSTKKTETSNKSDVGMNPSEKVILKANQQLTGIKDGCKRSKSKSSQCIESKKHLESLPPPSSSSSPSNLEVLSPQYNDCYDDSSDSTYKRLSLPKLAVLSLDESLESGQKARETELRLGQERLFRRLGLRVEPDRLQSSNTASVTKHMTSADVSSSSSSGDLRKYNSTSDNDHVDSCQYQLVEENLTKLNIDEVS